MPDLKNQPSVSDSTVNKNHDQEGTFSLIDAEPDLSQSFFTQGVVIEENGHSPDHHDELSQAVDQVADPPALDSIASPADSTVKEPVRRSRSIRMRWRFWRTLFFALWMFVRLLFWQIYVYRYFPSYVRGTDLRRWTKYAREYHNFAVKRGGVFIKLGQFISTRVDILPEEIIKELETLQDEVPTIKFKRIQKVLIDEIGSPASKFEWINETPIAAASLGQVHRGKLVDGERVVIKVQRPGIRTICYTDLAAMRVVAKVAMRFKFISRRTDALGLVNEFGEVLLQELSYNHEAYNALRFAHMFKDDMGVYIPAVYHEISTDRVLIMEDVTSIKITDYATMEKAGISRKAVAKRLMDTYLPQVFNEYFFHADPHPGNLFVYPLPVEDDESFGKNGRPFYLIFIDFGMTGTLNREIADGMVTTLNAILTRDAKSLVEGYAKLGFILPGADLKRIIKAVEGVFDQVWGLSMSDLRDIDYDVVRDIGQEFTNLIFSMPVYIPQDFIYLGRTVSIMSGMCTSLDPEFNPWKELQPYTEALIARGFGMDLKKDNIGSASDIVQNLFRGESIKVMRNIGEEVVRRTFPPLARAESILTQIEDGEVHVISEMSVDQEQQLKRIERETRRTNRSMFFGSVLVASTLFYTNGETTAGIVGFVICGVTLIIGELKN